MTSGAGEMAGAADPDCFTGATIRLFQVEVLVVYVPRHVVGDRALAPTVVAAFHARFNRTIVLAAQDRCGVPTYFGPAPIATVLSRIPFDALAWRRYRYRKAKPMMLPIPTDPLPEDRNSWSAWHGDQESRDHARGTPPVRDSKGNHPASPATRDPASRNPGTRDLAGREPATRDLAGREPATRDLAGRERATRDLAGHEPDLAGHEPATRGLAGREPATRDLAGREPATRDLAAARGFSGRDRGDRASAGRDLALARSNARRTRTLIPDHEQAETRR
jgi:hypothetical protein